MTTVYHSGETRSRRVLWVLEELGVPYEVRSVQFPPKTDAAFLKVSPAGTLPAFRDGDVFLTESLAIGEYLAHTHDGLHLTVRPHEAGWTDYLEWLHYGEATLTTMVAPIVRHSFLLPEAERRPEVVHDYRGVFTGRLDPVQRALSDGRDYLAGGRFTLADVSVGYGLRLATLLGMGDQITDDLKAYDDRLRARPAYQRAYAVA